MCDTMIHPDVTPHNWAPLPDNWPAAAVKEARRAEVTDALKATFTGLPLADALIALSYHIEHRTPGHHVFTERGLDTLFGAALAAGWDSTHDIEDQEEVR